MNGAENTHDNGLDTDAAASVAWAAPHRASELLAERAHAARRDGLVSEAEDLFRQAAGIEEVALAQVGDDKPRTIGILAVSAVSLWVKGKDNKRALLVAHLCLSNPELPDHERAQLDDAVFDIYAQRRRSDAAAGPKPDVDPATSKDWRSALAVASFAPDGTATLRSVALLSVNAELQRLGSVIAVDVRR